MCLIRVLGLGDALRQEADFREEVLEGDHGRFAEEGVVEAVEVVHVVPRRQPLRSCCNASAPLLKFHTDAVRRSSWPGGTRRSRRAWSRERCHTAPVCERATAYIHYPGQVHEALPIK